ncbi:L-histidine N(alpha)-methyltransferase [Streptomyces arenae]|uniref:L-histidine N(alpha)-methyltransferase n=1 Tax=Streptomyces arenae TaxID=29301 RepID=UPI002659845C|nr:L-histidine N(alpha)-methyltransferase [Streptomyces arenae]MCG7202299.1 L-histidine N(alpha)-methyltransferase [Streptomyces arenae]
MSQFLITRTLSEEATDAALRADVLRGLTRRPKALPPKWFYDAHGSDLFEMITELPEYYPARAEHELLIATAPDIAAATGARTLIELGSGSSQKTAHLLDALSGVDTYIPIDVSESALTQAGHTLTSERPALNVHALIADFTTGLAIPGAPGPRLIAFLGSTIGNLPPVERAAFLYSIRALLEPGDCLLLGVDLVKKEEALVAAYDDAAGVTAAFNKNLLAVLNQSLDADFDLDAFDHVARWDPAHEWVEMLLRSRTDQNVKIPALGLTVDFTAGEDLRTEISAKFRMQGIRRELTLAGMELARWWTAGPVYGLALAQPIEAQIITPRPYAPRRPSTDTGTP